MVIKENQLNEMMKDVLTDMQQYLNKFTGAGAAAGSSASSKEKVQTGDTNIDPIKVIHATILGICHF